MFQIKNLLHGHKIFSYNSTRLDIYNNVTDENNFFLSHSIIEDRQKEPVSSEKGFLELAKIVNFDNVTSKFGYSKYRTFNRLLVGIGYIIKDSKIVKKNNLWNFY